MNSDTYPLFLFGVDRTMVEEDEKPSQGKIKVLSTSQLDTHDKIIVEFGKETLLKSISIGREFCASMITICSGAIPVYLAVITFYLPDNYNLSLIASILAVSPAFFFLFAIISFAWCYYPKHSQFDPKFLDDIEKQRITILEIRRKQTVVGFSFFTIGVIWALIIIIIILWLNKIVI